MASWWRAYHTFSALMCRTAPAAVDTALTLLYQALQEVDGA